MKHFIRYYRIIRQDEELIEIILGKKMEYDFLQFISDQNKKQTFQTIYGLAEMCVEKDVKHEERSQALHHIIDDGIIEKTLEEEVRYRKFQTIIKEKFPISKKGKIVESVRQKKEILEDLDKLIGLYAVKK